MPLVAGLDAFKSLPGRQQIRMLLGGVPLLGRAADGCRPLWDWKGDHKGRPYVASPCA